MVGAGIATTLTVFDYVRLRKFVPYTRTLERKIEAQRVETENRHRQLKTLVSEVDGLRSKMLALSELEDKIRKIAGGVDTPSGSDGFGTGGPMPEDSDPLQTLMSDKEDILQQMHYQLRLLEETSTVREEQLEAVLDYLATHRKLFDCTPSLRPCRGRITARYGYRKSPFNGRREIHKGMDIAGRSGTPIVATADGVVSFVGRRKDFGRVIEIDHGRGIVTRYAHCKKILKKLGTKVKRGESIALMGSSGRSTGTHLHYEVRLNGIPLDPAKFILN
jgi:murein DD-endopeptidase MepM/ murein hydrolase activator NlpD